MSSSQMQIVVINLLPVGEYQTVAVRFTSTCNRPDDWPDLQQTVYDKPVTTLFSTALLQAVLVHLPQARSHPVASVRYHQACCDLTNWSGLTQPFDSLRQLGEFVNLQQVCEISGRVIINSLCAHHGMRVRLLKILRIAGMFWILYILFFWQPKQLYE